MIAWIFRQFRSRKGDLWLISAKWTAPILSLVGGLIVARNLKPEELGVVSAVTLIPAYTGILQFGIFSGLNRNLPLFRAKGDLEQAQRFVNASSLFAIGFGIFRALIAAVTAAYFYFTNENSDYAYIAGFLVLTMGFAPLKLHQDVIYRGTRQFDRLGKNLHIINLWAFFCSVSTAFLGLTGLALKVGTLQLVGWLLLLPRPPMKAKGGASFSDLKTLSAVGLPIMFSGMVFIWLSAADRTIIATFLTAEDLGHYALAGIAVGVLSPFTASINMLLYPRVAHAFGAKGSSRHLRRYIWIGLALNLVMLIPVALVGWLCMPYFVKTFLPEYVPGIDAARITLLGGVFTASSGPSVIIPILRRNLRLHLAGGLSIAVLWILGILAVKLGYGIEGIAVARVCGLAVYSIFIIAYVFHLTRLDIPCND